MERKENSPRQPEVLPLPKKPGVVEPIFAAGEIAQAPTGRPVDPLSSPTDHLGSYTGRPADGGQPVQDADDL